MHPGDGHRETPPAQKKGVNIMASYLKKFKQLNCRYVGADCNFVAQAKTEEKVMELAFAHGCIIHDICDVSPGTERRMRSLIRDVWV